MTAVHEALVVYLKDTFFAGRPGAAQWNYTGFDARDLIVEVRGSGLLWIGRENPDMPEDGHGKRRREIAVFPPGGWSGYCWEPLTDQEAARLAGLAVAR